MKTFNTVLLLAGLFLLSQVHPKAQTSTQQTLVDLAQIAAKISAAPTIAVTMVGSTTPNSFPLPAGKTVCIVTRNIAQSAGIDYNITSGAVVFTTPPQPGDVVQLNCW